MTPPPILDFFLKLQVLRVPAELHMYQSGGHGSGLGTPECNCASWMDLFRNWVVARQAKLTRRLTVSTGARDSLVRRFPLVAYFGLTYLITWALLLPLALSARGLLPPSLPPSWHALGALGPFTAAFLVTRATGGAGAVRIWLSGFTRWRTGPVWWLAAVASPFLLFVVSAVFVRFAGAPWPDMGRLLRPEYANGTWLFDLLFVGTFAYGLGEEPGWRGFALPRLQQRHGPLLATLILTPLWAAFHWPAFFYRPGYQGGLPTIVGFLFGLLAGATVLTFLYNGTRGSLLLVTIWHGLINIAMEIAAVVSQPVVATMNVLIAVAAVAIMVWWGLMERRKPPTIETDGERASPTEASAGTAPMAT